MSTVIPARHDFQEKVRRPVPRSFCKWWAKGHQDPALTAETKWRGMPHFLSPPNPGLPPDRQKVGLQSHTYWLCDLEHVACLRWASGSSPEK